MNRRRPALWCAAALLALGCTPAGDSPLAPQLDLDAPALSAAFAGPKLVISQVYGGGGNSGSKYTHDFVELYNAGDAPAPLGGLTLQYGSSGGDIGASGGSITTVAGSLAPGRYYLIQLAKGSGGTTALPAPDATGTTAAAATAGKFAIITGSDALGCSSSTKPCSTEQLARIVDLVGFGSANFFEGSDGTPAPSNTKAVLRKANGAQDTDDNFVDFEALDPAPRNSAFGGIDIGPLASLTLAGAASIKEGLTTTITAVAADAEGDAISSGAVSWSVEGASVELVSTAARTATVRAIALGASTIHGSITEGGTTRSASWEITVVEAGAPARITVDFPPGSLPPGFDYFPYPTVLDADNVELRGSAAALTYSTSTPDLLSIDPATNIITTKAEGRGYVTLTATNGHAYTFYVEVNDGAESGVSYQDHVDFGTPTDATPGDDLLVTYPQYVASYNAALGQPNWVAYNLEASHRGASDRCDCFTSPNIPGVPKLTTFDYTNSGFSRGHLVMSEDRTAGGSGSRVSIDNARTFYFSNIIPQTSANNGGPWLKLETELGRLATAENKELFILAGGAKYSGTLANSGGKIAIPTWTWKIAVVLPRDHGLANVDDLSDLEIIAVAMPNATSMPHSDWESYRVTVDSVEALTGYDFLSLLPDAIERIVESGDRAPTAATSATGGVEGQVLTFDGRGSSDPDVGGALQDVLSYKWIVNGHVTSESAVVTGSFPDNGTVSVMLVVTDRFGWADTATTSVAITNVAPQLAPFAGATILQGETYTATSAFADPGQDSWTATVNYGDGSGTQALALDGFAFSLAHRYTTAGTFTVAVTVSDDDAGSHGRHATVTVESTLDGVRNLRAMLGGELQSLIAKLNAAEASLRRGSTESAVGQLAALVNEMEAMVASGRIASADAERIIGYARRVIESVQG